MLESKVQAKLIGELERALPGCIILKNDANYLQGFPDLIVLFENKWAALEVKASRNSKKRPNQEYYVNLASEMSFGAFVYPENLEEVIDAIQSAFKSKRHPRISIGV